MKNRLLNILYTISLALNGIQGCTSQNSEKLNIKSGSFSLENNISNTYSEILSRKPSKRIIVNKVTDSPAYHHIYNFEGVDYKLQLTFISQNKNRGKPKLAILVYKERDNLIKEIFYDNELNGLDGISDDEYRSSTNSTSSVKQFERIYRFNSSNQDSLNNRLIGYLSKLVQKN